MRETHGGLRFVHLPCRGQLFCNNNRQREHRMARVTVEDCVDKIPNRFELLLIAAYRARMLGNGAHMNVEPENDKNAVIALREIAAKTISANDLRESLIHSLQEQVEIDEPEEVPAPVVPRHDRPILGRDSRSSDTTIDVMTEEELLRGLEKWTPFEPQILPSG
jgi:DNA-directed RNA polymerase subunit omega